MDKPKIFDLPTPIKENDHIMKWIEADAKVHKAHSDLIIYTVSQLDRWKGQSNYKKLNALCAKFCLALNELDSVKKKFDAYCKAEKEKHKHS